MRDVIRLDPAHRRRPVGAPGDRPPRPGAAEHRITIDGGLEYRLHDAPALGAHSARALHGSTGLRLDEVNVTLLDVHEVVDDREAIEVLMLGSLQHDDVLTVTVVVARAESPGFDDDRLEAFSTVVAADTACPFEVTHRSLAGDRAVARGTIRNEVLRTRRADASGRSEAH